VLAKSLTVNYKTYRLRSFSRTVDFRSDLNHSLRIENLVVKVLEKVYEYLCRDDRVVRPGSIRSFEAAALDAVMRISLESGVDNEKFKRIVTRTGIENLILSVETLNPDEKREVLREAFEYALNEALHETIREAESLMRSSLSQQTSRESKSTKESESSSRSNSSGLRSSYQTSRRGFESQSSETSISRMYDHLSTRRNIHTVRDYPNLDVTSIGESDDKDMNDILTTMYEVLYGGVGTANFLNLAQLINMFAHPYANIIQKVIVLRKMENYLRSYGLLQMDYKTRRSERRVFEELRNVVRGTSSEGGQVKVIKFTDPNKYPTYVVSVREFRFGDNYSSIDLDKTALNISRKLLMNKPVTTRDIIVKEYAGIKTIDLVLCLDVSGSMRELSWGVPKIEIAKDAISKYINFLTTTSDRLALILFNFRADVLWSLHMVKKFWKYMMYILKYIYAGGGTNLAHALERAKEVLARSRNSSKHVVCITDGRTVNANLCIKEACKLRRSGATISTIAIGENSDDDLLMRLSKIGGGLFIKISSIYELSRALIVDKLHTV